MIKYTNVLAAVLLTANISTAVAESVYIKDTLRWSLRAEPNKSSQSLRLVTSGMKVKTLAEQDNYTQIQLESGEIGWVSTSNLVNEKTNNVLLKETEKRLEKTQKELDELKQKSPVAELEAQIANIEKEKEALELSLSGEKEKVKTLRAQLSPSSMDLSPNQQKFIGMGIACICLFFVGLILGKGMVEKKVRAKFNGMKVW